MVVKYKSKHTGAQIDEAVSKVLNGEVGGGADWNAQEGEAGYIENKPCSIDYMIISDNPVISDMSTAGFENSETYEVSVQYASYMNIIGLCVVRDSGYSGVIYVPIKYGEINNLVHTIYDVGYDSQVFISIDAAYGPMGSRQIKVKSNAKITKIIGVAGFNKINENFIPNTVIKTTPQTLSGYEKNQALANLGIADLLEALKPVELVTDEDFPEGDNVSQEDLDFIGLTRSVIDNIINGITTKIKRNGALFDVKNVYEYNNTFTFSLVHIEYPEASETEVGIIYICNAVTCYNVRYNGTNYICSLSSY